MVRKTTRSVTLKTSENARRESPRITRTRKSSSRSEGSDVEVIANIKRTQSPNQSEKESSSNDSDTDSKKPLKKRTRSMVANNANTENKSQIKDYKIGNQQDDKEEVNEENISKGKSKSINKSNNDDVIPETQNENVQVTDESPNDTKDENPPIHDELSKNGMETSAIDVNISQTIVAEMTCDNQSSKITTGQSSTEIAILELVEPVQCGFSNSSYIITQVNLATEREAEERPLESKSAKKGVNLKDSFDSLIKEETTKDTSLDCSKKIKLNRLARDKNTFSDKVEKERKTDENETRRKITLKRLESKPQEENQVLSPLGQTVGDNWTSSYESANKEYEQLNTSAEKYSSRKKITLKRSTIEDTSESDKKENSFSKTGSYLFEKTESRKSPTREHVLINEIQRRRSMGIDQSTSKAEETTQKPKKPTKVVKLIRQLPQERQEPPPPGDELVKVYKWGQSKFSHSFTEVLNLKNIKEVCPDVEFLNEEDVDLEIVMKENKLSEKVKRKTFTELEEEEMENIEAELNAEPGDVEIKENIIAMNRKISIVDDTASKLNPPPSPAKNSVSEVLFITNLVRPFTVKQLKELLERTGKIREDGFWTDRIKSKCYVYYETAEEAESTRNALHGVHWPIGNGKKLIIDYSTLEDMENAKNLPNIPHREKSPLKENKKPAEIIEKTDLKPAKPEKDVGKEDKHRRRRSYSRSGERREKKHSRRSHTPEDHYIKKHKHGEPVPQKAMDDLFSKTKATPSIYWQPLTPEEITRKQQQRQIRLEENKRRLEEIRSSGRTGVRDRGVRDRNFRRR